MTTSRRAYGTGTLTHLGGDRWRFRDYHDGVRLSRVFRAPNQTAANKAVPGVRRELVDTHDRRKDADGVERERRQEWTVSRYADYYLEKWASVHLASSTRAERKRVLESVVKPAIGTVKMRDVTPTTLQDFYRRLEGRTRYDKKDGDKIAGATIWKIHTAIRALFSFAVDVMEDFQVNPAAHKAARPSMGQVGGRKRAVDVHEVESFVALVRAEKPEIAVPVMLCAWLGARRSEVLALRRKDFDLETGEVVIRRSVTETPDDGMVVREYNKTATQRVVPLDGYTIGEMRALFAEQRRQRAKLGPGWMGAKKQEDDWVCAQGNGEVIGPVHFNAVFRAFVKKHELQISPHLLRHALVSQLIAKGYDAVTISAITGHSPGVLLKTYAHAFDKRKQEAIEALGADREAARAAH